MGIELTNEQIYATYNAQTWFRSSSSKQVFEISGPAGSGKTTLVLYIIESLGLDIKDVLFCAYMGKAATQLIRSGVPAKTIHSAIYYTRKEKYTNAEGKECKKTVFVKKLSLDRDYKLIVVDEGSTVSQGIAEDLLSFGVPVIVLGDLNQLPPVFGRPIFLNNPDVILTKIMRQNENNPIIYLSQQILDGKKLQIGVYGKSSVIDRKNLNRSHFTSADIVLTGTNILRHNVNNLYREQIKHFAKLDFPYVGEKVVCRKNNWKKCIDDTFYLTNGTTGYIEYLDKSTYNGKTFEMDFRPDYLPKEYFKHLRTDYKHLYSVPSADLLNRDDVSRFYDKFEFAYAITVHISQGSQYERVLYLSEDMMRSKDDQKRLQYTAITRASKRIVIAV